MANFTLGAMLRRDIAPHDLLAHAKALEPLVDELWIVEDLSWAGGISQMAAVLGATNDVVVGHGIAPSPFRNAAALAMEWAALADMWPGRVACGLGHGVQSWMAQLGAKPESPLTHIEETCVAVQQLLAGERVVSHGRYVTVDDVELVFPPASPPPVSLGVLGPKSLRLSGRIASGTILPEGQGPDEIKAALKHINAGRAEAGVTEPHRLTVFAGVHLGSPDEVVRNPDAPVGWESIRNDEEEIINDVLSLAEAGADTVVLVPMGKHPASVVEFLVSVQAEGWRRLEPGTSRSASFRRLDPR